MNDNNTLADDLREELEDERKSSLALMKLLSDEKHKSEALDAELARCRAANVYDANAHRKAAELDVAVERIRELEALCAAKDKVIYEYDFGSTAETASEPVNYGTEEHPCSVPPPSDGK